MRTQVSYMTIAKGQERIVAVLGFLAFLIILGINMPHVLVALAQDTTTTNTTVDFTPVWQSAVSIAAAVLSALALWVGVWLKSWLQAKTGLVDTALADKLQQMYNEAALRGIAYAESVVDKNAPKSVDVGSPLVKTAADYVIRFWPELVGKLGLTPEDIQDTIVARLPTPTAKRADEQAAANAGAATVVK